MVWLILISAIFVLLLGAFVLFKNASSLQNIFFALFCLATSKNIIIEREALPHIFDPFYTKGKHKGMGLGLAVVDQTIKRHNGDIKVESAIGKGTRFYISFRT